MFASWQLGSTNIYLLLSIQLCLLKLSLCHNSSLSYEPGNRLVPSWLRGFLTIYLPKALSLSTWWPSHDLLLNIQDLDNNLYTIKVVDTGFDSIFLTQKSKTLQEYFIHEVLKCNYCTFPLKTYFPKVNSLSRYFSSSSMMILFILVH